MQYFCIVKLLSVTILFICLLAASFSNWLLIAAFEINQQFISSKLCVNRNNPGSHCNGHCFLNKQLDNEERSGAPLNTAGKEKFEIQLFCIDADTDTNINTATVSVSNVALHSFSKQFVLKKHFHPPCTT